jgi:hypothetical protein
MLSYIKTAGINLQSTANKTKPPKKGRYIEPEQIQDCGKVRIHQQFSDASIETLHVLANLELVENFMSNYLKPCWRGMSIKL